MQDSRAPAGFTQTRCDLSLKGLGSTRPLKHPLSLRALVTGDTRPNPFDVTHRPLGPCYGFKTPCVPSQERRNARIAYPQDLLPWGP